MSSVSTRRVYRWGFDDTAEAARYYATDELIVLEMKIGAQM